MNIQVGAHVVKGDIEVEVKGRGAKAIKSTSMELSNKCKLNQPVLNISTLPMLVFKKN
ncbi:Uncharacterised protein [Weissella viridescens]|uniref:Uncharacterized protein n=1 Tax=Weissella viridescens TaxID=1629 RepID=A0A380P8G6_WEIVI|nr:Uncharacterised protein [Weissella viridescens]